MRAVSKRIGDSLALAGAAALLSAAGCAGSSGAEGESLGEAQQPVYDWIEDQGIWNSGTQPASLRENVVVSLWKKGKWSTPGAKNDGDGCSGTLITSRLVLTAASCLRRLDSVEPDVYVGPKTPDVAGQGEATKFESTVRRTWGSPATEPTLMGIDLAVLELKTSVLEAAIIHRPPLTAPSALGPKDANNWAAYAAGISGWSPFTSVPNYNVEEARTNRQTFFKSVVGDDELRLNRIVMSTTGLWAATTVKPISNQPKIGLAPGDNGGPLFVKGVNDRLDVVGVGSVIGLPPDPLLNVNYQASQVPSHIMTTCTTPPDAFVSPADAPYQCNFWVDLTSTAAKQFITAAATDSRSTRWRAMHPRVGEGQSGTPWFGEVDYTGPCTPATDSDCDHILNINTDGSRRDNCVGSFNPDQVDTDDANMGDVCINAWMTAPCYANTSCETLTVSAPSCYGASTVTSPAAPYGNGLTYQQFQSVVNQDSMLQGQNFYPEVSWGDTPPTAANCASAKLELTVYHKHPTTSIPSDSTTTNHRYSGVWNSSTNTCGFALDAGYSERPSFRKGSAGPVRLAGSARFQSGGVSTYKKVRLGVVAMSCL